ncbi:MAG: hypothetical protein LKE27_11460 [Atopobiaceae bacterium]|jgi:hypothetical protein|nr:hypothetical protein [Atopobiaceae bacterium]
MFSLHSVFGSDGSVHQEQQMGNMRIDLTTGKASTVLGQSGGIQTVIGPDGKAHIEHQMGNTRFDLTNGKTSHLF